MQKNDDHSTKTASDQVATRLLGQGRIMLTSRVWGRNRFEDSLLGDSVGRSLRSIFKVWGVYRYFHEEGGHHLDVFVTWLDLIERDKQMSPFLSDLMGETSVKAFTRKGASLLLA